ncbi:cbb3-type cytochrome c oxidase N-terminal domain-containing protein [Mangrovibacterium sp.]|uniref:cbb3-type cytochrome c oxidase N-terminal domain-containing protein n=1 Tax=Mangrovibacterium sp. TaxID=1961364 RepID=UPI0035667685
MTTHDKTNKEYDDQTQIKYIGGHDYDGIRELDNRLPPWLKYLFYLSIVFAAGYLMLVFVFKDDSILQELEYKKEMAALQQVEEQQKEAAPVVVKERSREDILAAGQETFTKICSVCHGKFAEGLVGPNMADEYWIHGGSFEDMKRVVLEGVIEKGMISYKNQLSNRQIDDVLIYIQSLQGTNPPNAKAAEGDKYVPEATAE